MSELDERIEQTLAELSVVSEVAAAKIGRSSASSDEEHGIPAGVKPSLRSVDKPPEKDRSLFDFYRWHFARAKTDQARRVLLYLAEGDLEARRHTAPADRTALGVRGTTSDARDQRILAWYPGIHPLEAAILESSHGGYCSEENVKAVRRKARRDPMNGYALKGWAGWSDEERVKRHSRARLEGKSLDRMAQEFEAPKSTIQSFVERKRKLAA